MKINWTHILAALLVGSGWILTHADALTAIDPRTQHVVGTIVIGAGLVNALLARSVIQQPPAPPVPTLVK